MSDQQLYLSIGVPSLVALIGILINVTLFTTLNTRISSLESRLDSRISTEIARLESNIQSLLSKFDILTGKVIELDNRLTRLEERLKHS